MFSDLYKNHRGSGGDRSSSDDSSSSSSDGTRPRQQRRRRVGSIGSTTKMTSSNGNRGNGGNGGNGVNGGTTTTRRTRTTTTKPSSTTTTSTSRKIVYGDYLFKDIKRAPGKSLRKYDAYFEHIRTKRPKIISFGKKGEKDYLTTPESRYDPKNLMSVAALTRYILWNKKPFADAVKDYTDALRRSSKA